MKAYRILAINDETDSCNCCGKQGLKKVVWMEEIETGIISHFGTTCASIHSNIQMKEMKKAHKSNTQKAYAEYRSCAASQAMNAKIKEANKLDLDYAERKAFFGAEQEAQREAKKAIKAKYHLVNL